MKFDEYVYTRPDEEETLAAIASLQNELETAADYDAFLDAFKRLDQLNAHYHSNSALAEIRHTVNTNDAFYDTEAQYLDALQPKLDHALNQAYQVVLDSPYNARLRKDVPAVWFQLVEYAIKSVSSEIIPYMQEENRLSTEYGKLIASAQIPFEGKTYTLASLEEKMNDADEEVRRAAHKAYWGWFADHEEQIGAIYDQLVKVRDAMARKLGYENYIPLGYLRMDRLDYDQKDVENYRRNVLEDVVPVTQKLYASQAERLGKDTLKTWNEKVEFTSGNARPHFSREEMVEHALQMYKELDPATGEFFQFMVDHDLMDLDSKPGKAGGGYCTFMFDYSSPFIFANFNKTQHDAEVLTHEAGHAFQSFTARNNWPADLVWATMESAEIDSMSMEFFTWPWMKLFFEEDADKYRYGHLSGAVKFIPYGVLVDHFQHEVYAHPQWSHKERMDAWRRLEKQYLPHKNYDEIDVLERGGWWMRQQHIFQSPFYYIDYTLAQVVALEFWKRKMEQDPQAFEDYKKICKIGGMLPFKKIVEAANVEVPFTPGCLKDTMASVQEWFDSHPADFD